MTEQPHDEDRFAALESNLNDLNDQVGAIRQDTTAIRQDVTDARRDAAAARILAGGADRDVNEARNEYAPSATLPRCR